jgi:hypothetical protein
MPEPSPSARCGPREGRGKSFFAGRPLEGIKTARLQHRGHRPPPSWQIRCTMWNSKNGSEWVAFPCREWLDCDGHRQFAVLLEFSDKDVERRFKDAALTAIHAFASGSGA